MLGGSFDAEAGRGLSLAWQTWIVVDAWNGTTISQVARTRRRSHRSTPSGVARAQLDSAVGAEHPVSPASRGKPLPLFVLGAGVDASAGMPTVTSLITELAHFAGAEGAPIHAALRAKLPYLRFSFDKFAGDQREDVLRGLFDEDEALATTLNSIRAKLPETPIMQAFGVVIGGLTELASHNVLHGEKLRKVQAASDEDLGEAEPILDPGRIPLRDTSNQVLRKGLQEALRQDAALAPEERQVLETLIEATSNIEELLALYFIRFISGSRADKQNYLYLIWMLWALLRSRSAASTLEETSLYSRLRGLAGHVITFNYTPFITRAGFGVGQTCFFHGRLDQYLALDSRAVMNVPDHILSTQDESKAAQFLQPRRLDVSKGFEVDVPALVPPTAFKPVITREQLLSWAEADHALQEATLVIVAGYSFAFADEHFNDLLRKGNPYSRIVVVNPDPRAPVDRVCHLFEVDRRELRPVNAARYPSQTCGRLVCVQAKADDIDHEFVTEVDAFSVT